MKTINVPYCDDPRHASPCYHTDKPCEACKEECDPKYFHVETPHGACPHCKGPSVDCGGHTFVKQYFCECGTQWEDTWCCACNDRCPSCGVENEPDSYEEVLP